MNRPRLWEYLIFPFQVVLAFTVCVAGEFVFLIRDFVRLVTGKKIK